MKKSYFLMAATAALFAACAETDFVNEAAVVEGNAPQAIGFEGFAGKSTRAEIANVGLLQDAGFNVWGYTGTAPEDVVFDGDNVDYDDGAWTYVDGDPDVLKPWEAGKTYLFGAIAPQTATGTLSNAGVYTITGATSGYAKDVTDYLIAETQSIPSNEARLVTLDFKHIMSKVSVKVTGSADVTINKIEMKGWKNDAGSFTSPTTWAIASDATANYTNVYDAGTGNYVETAIVNGNSGAEPFLIVPQTATLTFKLTYKVGALDYVKEVEVADQVLAQNTHTTFTFSVGAAYILFDATLTDWATKTAVNKPIEN